MNVFILTIHHPEISLGPNARLQGFLKSKALKGVKFTLPPFVYDKTHTKFDTFMILLNSLSYITKNRKNIDLIHVVTPPSYAGQIAILAKKLFKIPYIVDIGDPYAENMALLHNFPPSSLKFKTIKKSDKTLYNNASHLILTSDGLRKYIPEDVLATTILTGIAPKKEIEKTLDSKFGKKYKEQKAQNSKKCLFLGQYGPLQNFEYILQVFIEAIKKDKEITLDIIGQGEKEKCEEIINQHPSIKKNFTFKSPIQSSEIPKIIKDYSCGIVSLALSPNLDYAIPTKLLSYLTFGLPIFGTGGKSAKFLIKSSNTGYISNKYDIEKDSKALLNLLKDIKTLETYSKNALKFALHTLTYESAGKSLLKIYKNCAKKP